MAIVRNILDILFPPRTHEVLVRCCTYEKLLALMHPVRIGTETIALLPYRNTLVQALIIEAKFHNNIRAQELLGQILKRYLLSVDLSNSILVPVPLSSKRYKERGYNQTERVGNYTGLSISTGLLTRTRDTLPQTTLSGSLRRTNILGAFIAPERLNPHTTYIILDDVVTTGATLKEAVRALREGGACTIVALALAH
jgi:ComF family protein